MAGILNGSVPLALVTVARFTDFGHSRLWFVCERFFSDVLFQIVFEHLRKFLLRYFLCAQNLDIDQIIY